MQTLGTAEQTKEYLDLNELTERIPFRKRAIEEFIARGVLIEGVHFRQPAGPKGKRVFFWSSIEQWLRGKDFLLKANHVRKSEQARDPIS
jgi:hypothetical protein